MSFLSGLFGGGNDKPPEPPKPKDTEAEAQKRMLQLQKRSGYLSTILNRSRQTGGVSSSGGATVG